MKVARTAECNHMNQANSWSARSSRSSEGRFGEPGASEMDPSRGCRPDIKGCGVSRVCSKEL